MRSLIPKSKKGDAPSLIIGLIIIVFVIGIVVLVFSKFFPAMLEILKNEPQIAANNNSVTVINMVQTKTIPWLDYFFLFSFVSIIIGLIVSSIFIDTHPSLMIIFIIVLVVAIVLGGIMSNAFTTIGETDVMLSTYNQFTMTKGVMSRLPVILFAAGLLVIFILYGKSRSGGGIPI